MAPKTTVCTKMPGDQVVDIGDAARHADGAAEHVAEEQHEDDRLDRREDEQLRHAPVGDEVAAGDAQRVAHGARRPAAQALRGPPAGGDGDGGVLMPPSFRPAGRAPHSASSSSQAACLPVERQEDIVQARLAHGQRGRREALGVQRAQHVRPAAPAPSWRPATRCCPRVRDDPPLRPASSACARRPASSLGMPISMTVLPSRAFNAVAVSLATTWPWSITAMRSASWSASSRYCVVSSTVEPSATSSRMTAHNSWRLWMSRPVVGSSRKRIGGRAPAPPRRRDGGACHPNRSAPAGRPANAGRSAPAARRRALPVCARHLRQTADQLQVLAAGEVGVHGRALPGKPDLVAHSRPGGHVVAHDLGPAAVGMQDGGQHAHERGLAGAVGSRPNTVAGRHLEIDALRSATTLSRRLPVDLRRGWRVGDVRSLYREWGVGMADAPASRPAGRSPGTCLKEDRSNPVSVGLSDAGRPLMTPRLSRVHKRDAAGIPLDTRRARRSRSPSRSLQQASSGPRAETADAAARVMASRGGVVDGDAQMEARSACARGRAFSMGQLRIAADGRDGRLLQAARPVGAYAPSQAAGKRAQTARNSFQVAGGRMAPVVR